jgi:SAM-dependent methyltransferase
LSQLRKKAIGYWERSIPWAFSSEKLSYRERRKLRYELQDYMHGAIPFGKYGSKLVLEIGSGSGIDSAEFAVNGANVVSLDFTHSGTRATLRTMKEAGLTPNVVRGAADFLPFRDSTFDCEYSFGVLHHLPEAGPAVDEIARTTKVGGDIICMLYNRNSLLYSYSILFLHAGEGASEKELLSRYSERNLGCPYTKAYTKDEAVRLFRRYFVAGASVHYNVIDTKETRKVRIEIPDRYELGWHILVKGKKSASFDQTGTARKLPPPMGSTLKSPDRLKTRLHSAS